VRSTARRSVSIATAKKAEMNESGKRLIGVVDDDPSVLESIENLLESAGYAVRTFDSAEAFRDSDAIQAVDCVISDLCMPRLDGRALAAGVRILRPELPFIFITGRESARLGEDRADDALRKPFDDEQLLAAVDDAIDGRR
jgi:FixJ family two-component response regulator